MKLIYSRHTWSLKTFCGKGLIRPYLFICVHVYVCACMCVCVRAYTAPRSLKWWPQAFLGSYFHVNKGINHFVLLAVMHLCIGSSIEDMYCISFLRKSTRVVSLFPHYHTSVQLPGLSSRSCDIAVRNLPEWVEGGREGVRPGFLRAGLWAAPPGWGSREAGLQRRKRTNQRDSTTLKSRQFYRTQKERPRGSGE